VGNAVDAAFFKAPGVTEAGIITAGGGGCNRYFAGRCFCPMPEMPIAAQSCGGTRELAHPFISLRNWEELGYAGTNRDLRTNVELR